MIPIFRMKPPPAALWPFRAARWATWLAPPLAALVTVLALLGRPADCRAAQLADDPQGAIEAGQDALLNGSNPPWYDASNDRLQKIQFPPERSSSEWNWNWGSAELWGQLLSWLAWGIVAVLVIAIIYLIVKAVLLADDSLPGVGDGNNPKHAFSAVKTAALPFQVEQPPEDFLAAARVCYAQGDYDKCVVYFYSHLLLELDRRQIVRLTRGKTNRQYVREAASQPRIAGYLELTMLMFEHVFFGKHNLERIELDRVWGRLDEFQHGMQEAGA